MKTLKILSVGNSFSEDTMEYVAEIALSLGYGAVKMANLYVGGCSLNKHFYHAETDAAVYRYSVNTGDGWSRTPGQTIRAAVEEEPWDWISIQHGTHDGSRYTSVESYEKLPALIEKIKGWAWSGARIAFNMAWVAEPYSTHHEIRSYDGNQQEMYKKLLETTQVAVLPVKGLDRLSPAGTAIQNARTTELNGKLSRDGFHLSLDIGRYIAGVTFLKALTDVSLDGLTWRPEGVDARALEIAVQAANCALDTPFAVTELLL